MVNSVLYDTYYNPCSQTEKKIIKKENIFQVQAYNARSQQWSVEEPLTSPRHKACAVGIDDFIVITGGTMLGLGKHKPSWLAEIGTRQVSREEKKKERESERVSEKFRITVI